MWVSAGVPWVAVMGRPGTDVLWVRVLSRCHTTDLGQRLALTPFKGLEVTNDWHLLQH